MAAPDLKTLLQFENQIEPAIVAALGAILLAESPLEPAAPGNVYAAHSMSSIVTPCLQIQLQVGAANGHRFVPPTKSYWWFDQWNVIVRGLVRSNRGMNAAQHAFYRSCLRLVMMDVYQAINPLLEYHAFAETPQERGTSYSVEDESNHDISEISFSSVLAIKPGAWPPVPEEG